MSSEYPIDINLFTYFMTQAFFVSFQRYVHRTYFELFAFSFHLSFLTSENGFLEKCSRQQNCEAVLYISLHPPQLILPRIRMIIKAIIIVVIIHFFVIISMAI